jgi:hypothetical protein
VSNWRDDPDFVRQADEDDLQTIQVESRWANLFAMVEQIFVPGGGGLVSGAQRALFKGFLWQAKKKVAVDPDGSRSYVIESMTSIAACLEIEPRELYPDLKPKPKEAAVG